MALPRSKTPRDARTPLESLYLDPAQAGVRWLLDPDNPDVVDGLRRAQQRKPTDECDAAALRTDIPDLLTVLRERHFGLATAEIPDHGLDDWAAEWQDRLDTEHPTTWGAALGTDMLTLRHLLHDGHVQAYGDRIWMVGGKYLGMWNAAVAMATSHDDGSVPDWLVDGRPEPAPDAELTVESGTDNQMPAGDSPWTGRMLVLTDRRTGSSGESVAWMLRAGLGARLAGRPTAGIIRYGIAAPYLLPRSGLVLILPTKTNDYPPDVELAGIPVDVELNPATPLEDVASHFNRIWSMAATEAA